MSERNGKKGAAWACAAVGTAVLAAAGAAAALSSKPMRRKRMMRQAAGFMERLGSLLGDASRLVCSR